MARRPLRTLDAIELGLLALALVTIALLVVFDTKAARAGLLAVAVLSCIAVLVLRLVGAAQQERDQ